MRTDLWQDWVILALSGWLFFSPMVLGFADPSHPASWVAFTSAIVLLVSASEALVVPDALEEVVDGGVGLALIASPWLLGYGGEAAPTLNALASGAIVLVSATWALARDLRTAAQGHHWASRA